jgi:hypothetical protein
MSAAGVRKSDTVAGCRGGADCAAVCLARCGWSGNDGAVRGYAAGLLWLPC